MSHWTDRLFLVRSILATNHQSLTKLSTSSLQIIERRIRVSDDLATWRRIRLRSDNLTGFLPLSASSVLAHRLLLNLKLREECVLLLCIHTLIVEHHLFFVVIVELADSPIGCIVIGLFLLWRHLVSKSLRIHNLVSDTLMLHLPHISPLIFGRRDQTCSEGIHLRLDLLLSLSSLLFSELLIHVLVDSLRTGSGLCATGHLLTHHLLECTVLLEFQDSLRFILLLLLLLLLLSQFVDVGFGQNACFMRLPLNIVKLLERFLLHKNL